MNPPPKDNQRRAAWVSGLLVWVLLGSGCLAASPQPQIGQDERGVGDFVLGSAGPAHYADQLPLCAGLDSPLSVCTPRRRTSTLPD